jgi:hypothetical protein
MDVIRMTSIGDARPRQCPALPLTVAANRPVRKIVLVRVIDRKNLLIQCFGWTFRLTGFGVWLSRTTQYVRRQTPFAPPFLMASRAFACASSSETHWIFSPATMWLSGPNQ